MRARFVVYALLACGASTQQFGFYMCNGLRAWSFVAGALTIFIALALVDRIVVTSASRRAVSSRLAWSVASAVVGGGLVWGLAWITTLTHMCG